MIRVTSVALCVFLSALCVAQEALTISTLGNGVEVRRGATVLRVTALKDGILRVRESATGILPEDASWAVLPDARAAHVAVTRNEDGFQTQSLRVSISADLRITVADLNGHILQQDAEPARWDGTRFRIHKNKAPDDHFFGLGDKPGPLDRTGQTYVMWNTDNFGWQESTDLIYKSIPFFIEFRAGQALGVLLDNTWRTVFDFGHELPGEYSFGAPDGPIDYYLVYGPDPKTVVESYAWLTGPTPLPPLWSLGFQQSRYSYESEARLNEVADRLRADRIPTDALYLDIDYQLKNRPFTLNAAAFPDFGPMVKKLADDKFHLVLITDLHIADLPGQGYAPYNSGAAGDHFVKNADGSTYVGQVWPGSSVFPDFTRQQTRAWWGTLYKQLVADGVSGFWNDMNEPAVFRYPTKTMPDDVQHRLDEPGFAERTANHLEIHNVYGMENSRATYDGILTLRPNERPFVLTRASYAGGQRYAATWTGDNSSTWNHLRMTTPQLLNLGLSGFSLSGADVGGFNGSPTPELLTKWLELAAFQPIDRDHALKGSRDREPWVDGPQQEDIRRRFIETRYRLMPYLYTTAEETSRDGLPILRPLFLESPHATDDGHPLDSDASGEFFFGPDLLVAAAPEPEQDTAYEVHLPPGVWYDYWTGERFDRTAVLASADPEKRGQPVPQKPMMATPALDKLPVYARGGSMIPIAPLVQSTDITPVGPLTVRVYVPSTTAASTSSCAGTVYLDDGHTFNFRKGQYLREQFSCRINADGSLTLIVAKHEGSYKPWWSMLRFEAYGWTPRLGAATSAGKRVDLQQAGAAVVAEIKDYPAGTEVTLQ